LLHLEIGQSLGGLLPFGDELGAGGALSADERPYQKSLKRAKRVVGRLPDDLMRPKYR
jgi:hypothetical protein